MSHFSDILSGEDKSFLLIINEHSEAGMALLGEDGKPIGWAFGEVSDVLQEGFRETNPGSVVLIPQNTDLCEATYYLYGSEDIEQVLDILNGPSCDDRGKLLMLHELGTLVEFVEELPEKDEHGNTFVRVADECVME